jgi:hypothetical protein
MYRVVTIGDVSLTAINSSEESERHVIGLLPNNQLFAYSLSAGLQTYPALFPPQPPPTGTPNIPMAINSVEPPVIVGNFGQGAGPVDPTARDPFWWVLGATAMTDFQGDFEPSAQCTSANDVNDAGDTVGNGVVLNPFAELVWLRPKGGQIIDLATTVDPSIASVGHINNASHIMGYSTVAGEVMPRTYFYDHAHNQFALLPYGASDLNDLNDHGVAVGGGTFLGEAVPGWLYDHSSNALSQLDLLPGGLVTVPQAINKDGQIVGQEILPHGGMRAITGSYRSGQVENLHYLDDDIVDSGPNGWQIGIAAGISNQGEIIAYGSWQNGPIVAVLLVPITIPTLGGLAAYIQILFGVINDGSGAGLVGGHLVHPDPWDPWAFLEGVERDLLLGIGINGLSRELGDPVARAEIRQTFARLVQRTSERLGTAPPTQGLGTGPDPTARVLDPNGWMERLSRLRRPMPASRS